MNKNSKILIFGGTGMLGSSILRQLSKQGFNNVNTLSKEDGFNLLNINEVEEHFKKEQPAYVFLVAGLVGGIQANNERQADFLYQNALMILNVIEAMNPQWRDLYDEVLGTGFPRQFSPW